MTGPTERDFPSLLTRISSRGDRTALSFYRGKTLGGRLTYAELQARVDSLAAVFSKQGLGIGDRVAILAPNRLEVPVLVLALLRIGAAVVPLNATSTEDDWAYILRHSGARGLCTTRELGARIAKEVLPHFTMFIEDALVESAPPSTASDSAPLDEAMAAVLYTSGTTGQPKGVVLRQRNLLSNAWSMARNFRLDGTTQYAVLPLYHAHAFGFGLMSALSTGGHLVFSERLEPFTWAEVIRAESVEVTSVVPTLLPMLLAARISKDKVPSLRHIMVSSAPLPRDLARDFQNKTGIPLIQGWGLSEYTNFACCVSPAETAEERERMMFDWEVPSIGPALEGTEVRILSGDPAAKKSALEGERGALEVRGHSTMLGYFQDPDATQRTIDEDGWLHTGDEGFFRVHGGRPIFFVTGRIKEIIIRDAEKYSPLKLEQRMIDAIPELLGKWVVLGFPHRAHGEEVGAYLEIDVLDETLKARIASAIEAMPVPERPKVIVFGPTPIPRTHTGKIQRRKLLPLFAPHFEHRGAVQFVNTIR